MIIRNEKRYAVKFQLLLPNGKFWRKIRRTSFPVRTDIGPEKAMKRAEKLWAKHGILIKPVSAEYLGEVKVLCCIEENPLKQPKSQSENSGT
jgi:hypothetical protein